MAHEHFVHKDGNGCEMVVRALASIGQTLEHSVRCDQDTALLESDRATSAAENARLCKALAPLAAIGEALATQDNRLTANPIFVVQRSRRTYGFDANYTEDCIAWIDGECVEADADKYEDLEAKWEETGDEPDDWRRTAYVDTWEHVMPFFTELAAQRYIDENGHNHGGKEHLRIYVDSGYRNHEWEEIRKACVAARAALAALAASPQVARRPLRDDARLRDIVRHYGCQEDVDEAAVLDAIEAHLGAPQVAPGTKP